MSTCENQSKLSKTPFGGGTQISRNIRTFIAWLSTISVFLVSARNLQGRRGGDIDTASSLTLPSPHHDATAGSAIVFVDSVQNEV